jgi:hypothetical protein
MTAPGLPGHAAGSRLSPWLGAGALYTALTALYAWPLFPVLPSHLPFDTGDPGLNVWILWWNTQALPLTERWWNAPIFFPVQGTFALSETLLGLAPLTVPLAWAGLGSSSVYNIAFLLSFPASALAAHALAHRLTGRHDAALLAGLAYGFSPYRAAHLPHLQLLWSCWMPLCLLALHRYLHSRASRVLVLAGICWVLNGLTSGYFLVYFAVLAGLWILWFARSGRDLLSTGAALAVATLPLAPLLAGYARHQRALGLTRNTGEIFEFSADLTGLWSAGNVWLARHWTFPSGSEGELYPGVVVLVLTVAASLLAWRQAARVRWSRWRIAVALTGGYLIEAVVLTMMLGPWQATVFGWRLSMTSFAKPLFFGSGLLAVALLSDARVRAAWRRRSTLFFYAAAAVAMALFALGPVARAFGEGFWPRAPYFWLMELPGLHALRVPARFGTLFVLCLGQAAALAFSRMTPHGARPPLVAMLAVAVLLDGWIPSLPVAPTPPPLELAAGPAGRTAVLELPSQNVFGETAAMLRSIAHGLPIANGFSGYAPPHYFALQEALAAGDPNALEGLRQVADLLVLVHTARDPEGRVERQVLAATGAELLRTTTVGPVYRLPAQPARPRQGVPLPIARLRATVNPELVPLMTDGRWDTHWHSGVLEPGVRLEILLSRPAAISRLELDLGSAALHFPRRLRVEVGGIVGNASPIWEGTTTGLAALALLEAPRRGPIAIALPAGTRGGRIVVELVGGHATLSWAVAELRVLGDPAGGDSPGPSAGVSEPPGR